MKRKTKEILLLIGLIIASALFILAFIHFENSDMITESRYTSADTVEVENIAGHYVRCPIGNHTDHIIITGHYELPYDRATYAYCEKHSYEWVIT
jgi:hypothetical protein